MNFEQIKTVALIGLVALSAVLTWQLWTFQPDYALLDPDSDERYAPVAAMSEERRLEEVIEPESIVVHGHEGSTALVPPNDEAFYALMERLYESELSELGLAAGQFPKQGVGSGVEIIYPTAIPSDLFITLLGMEEEEFNLPLAKIDRLFLYIGEDEERVQMQLLSYNDGDHGDRIIEADTTLSVLEFEEDYLNSMGDFIPATMLRAGTHFQKKLYVPTEEIDVRALSYTTTMLEPLDFMQALFSDPHAVKHYRQTNGEESYTDGSRIINQHDNGNFMEYNNPVYSDTQERSGKHVVQNSFEFINNHGGWTDDYYLDDWNTSDLRDVASFRLKLNGYPVLSFQGFDRMTLEVTRSGNQTTGYVRPMFDLDNQPIEGVGRKTLPSGEAVISWLEESEFFDPRRLEKITIGYEMSKPGHVIAEPFWFVLYDNRWEKVTFDVDPDGEGETNELE
ncbi:YycH family regulatory protein [Halalkalibacterium ligniniphilum]|uniref:YycH family regulatory protein n=1 Tax=Halalkalibacterium ligniniphilum TaxID=1134413 RepID=UPI0003492907|nr:two-component system activity regulator YycH [Halalkalibacterium ligniniphilum]